MADITQLSWTPIDKNDNISELIDKLNYNFSQFAMYNGGTPGADGEDGNDGMVTKSRCIIHTIQSDDSDYYDNYTEENYLNDVVSYYNKSVNNNTETWINDDIVIYGPCIYKYNESYNDIADRFINISYIKGQKGDKGDKVDSVSYFKISKSDMDSDADSDNDKTLSFDDEYHVNHLILDSYQNIYSGYDTLLSNKNAPIKYEADADFSLILSKNRTDGLTFFKVEKDTNSKNCKVADTIIRHDIESDNNGLTTSSSFKIWDKSSNGSSYTSDNGALYIGSKLNNSKYLYSIGVGQTATDDKTGINLYSYVSSSSDTTGGNINLKAEGNINLTSANDITLNSVNSFTAKFKNNNIISFGKGSTVYSSDGTIKDNNVLNISNIDNIITSGSLKLTDGDIDVTGNITLSKSILCKSKKWSISNEGYANFIKIIGYLPQGTYSDGKEEYKMSDISDIFPRITQGFSQIVDGYKLTSTESLSGIKDDTEGHKKALRNQIGAIDSTYVDEKLDGTTFTMNTYVPVGTIIMSALYSDTWIGDELGGLYRLCDGETIENGTTVKPTINDVTSSTAVKINMPTYLAPSGEYTVPDLRDRFIVGAGKNYTMFKTGGSTSTTLTANNLPRHRHEYAGNDDMKNNKNPNYSFSSSTERASFNTWKSVSKSGSDKGNGYVYYTDYNNNVTSTPINTIPPYYALTYYIKIQDTTISSSSSEVNENTTDD